LIWAHHIENQLMTLSPNDFPCIEDFLSKLEALRILLQVYKIDFKDYWCIYITLDNIGSAYYIFVYIFYASREALGGTYQAPTLDSFCDSLIREKYKMLQLGVIIIAGTSKKSLVD